MIDPSRIPTVDVLEAERRRGAALEAAEAGGADAGAAAPLLVDVREPGEFAAVRAEGAVLVPLSTFMLRYRDLPKDRPLLMICKSGGRSGQATAFLRANGWTDVVNVAGGTDAWERAGLPVRRGAPAPGEGDLPAEG
ncbi:MAG TPA: rhodanese-like domain-containing protein [Candidatus Sulfomarinibacteraceae bacterium]|nr:rhodanese-like domain-containing protein [Candidatus Sulfomarinibacteraceae bacterium]